MDDFGENKDHFPKVQGFFFVDIWGCVRKKSRFFKQHVPWSSLPGTWNMKYLFTYSTHSWPTLAISWIDTRRSHLGELSNYRWNKPKAAQRLLSWYKTNEFLITGNKESGRPTVWNYKSTIFISTYLLIASKTWWYLKIDIYIYISYILTTIYICEYICNNICVFSSSTPPPQKNDKFQPSKGEEEILVATAPPEVLIFFFANAMDELIVPRGDPSVGIHRNRSSRHSPHALVSGGVKWFFGVSFFFSKGEYSTSL